MTRQQIARAGVIAVGLMIAVAAFGAPLQARGYRVAICINGDIECQTGGGTDCSSSL